MLPSGLSFPILGVLGECISVVLSFLSPQVIGCPTEVDDSGAAAAGIPDRYQGRKLNATTLNVEDTTGSDRALWHEACRTLSVWGTTVL